MRGRSPEILRWILRGFGAPRHISPSSALSWTCCWTVPWDDSNMENGLRSLGHGDLTLGNHAKWWFDNGSLSFNNGIQWKRFETTVEDDAFKIPNGTWRKRRLSCRLARREVETNHQIHVGTSCYTILGIPLKWWNWVNGCKWAVVYSWICHIFNYVGISDFIYFCLCECLGRPLSSQFGSSTTA